MDRKSNKRGHRGLRLTTIIISVMARLLHVSVRRRSPRFFAVIGEQRAAFNARNKANTYVVTPHDYSLKCFHTSDFPPNLLKVISSV